VKWRGLRSTPEGACGTGSPQWRSPTRIEGSALVPACRRRRGGRRTLRAGQPRLRHQAQRLVTDDGRDRHRRGRAARPARPQRHVRAGDGPETDPASRWTGRHRHQCTSPGSCTRPPPRRQSAAQRSHARLSIPSFGTRSPNEQQELVGSHHCWSTRVHFGPLSARTFHYRLSCVDRCG
jgi:hypothetical protein